MFTTAIIICPIVLVSIGMIFLSKIFIIKRDQSDKYLISYTYNNNHYSEYIDDYELNKTTLYIYDNGEKTIYYNASVDNVIDLKED
jgi:hypothetical protein